MPLGSDPNLGQARWPFYPRPYACREISGSSVALPLILRLESFMSQQSCDASPATVLRFIARADFRRVDTHEDTRRSTAYPWSSKCSQISLDLDAYAERPGNTGEISQDLSAQSRHSSRLTEQSKHSYTHRIAASEGGRNPSVWRVMGPWMLQSIAWVLHPDLGLIEWALRRRHSRFQYPCPEFATGANCDCWHQHKCCAICDAEAEKNTAHEKVPLWNCEPAVSTEARHFPFKGAACDALHLYAAWAACRCTCRNGNRSAPRPSPAARCCRSFLDTQAI